MTFRDSGARHQLPRISQHAAPFPSPRPVSLHARRALRLFVTAGTWAAGFCLVAGSIALVAATAGRGNDTGRDAAARSGRLANHAGLHDTGARLQARPAGRRPAYREIVTFTGDGDRITSRFRVKADARWQLRWSFRCPSGAERGQLTVADAALGVRGTTALGAAVSQLGADGHGSTWRDPGRASHELVVLSSCSWTMKVVQAR